MTVSGRNRALNAGRIYQEFCKCVPVIVEGKTTLQKATYRPYWAKSIMQCSFVFSRFPG